MQNGLALGKSVSTLKTTRQEPRPSVQKLLRDESARLGIVTPSYTSYEVKAAPALATARTPLFRGVAGAKSAPLLDAAPFRQLRAVHQTIGRTVETSDVVIAVAGAEILGVRRRCDYPAIRE